jgi:hypothetical protein
VTRYPYKVQNKREQRQITNSYNLYTASAATEKEAKGSSKVCDKQKNSKAAT